MKLNATVWAEKSDILKGAYKGIEMYMLWLI